MGRGGDSPGETRTVLEQAMLDPAAVFSTPCQALTAAAIGRNTRIEILRRRGYDTLELEVVEAEDMAGRVGRP